MIFVTEFWSDMTGMFILEYNFGVDMFPKKECIFRCFFS